MHKTLSVFFLGMIALIIGCSNEDDRISTSNSEENPTADEILTLDEEADIFMFNGIIYNTNVDWVDELTLTKGDQVGEVKEQVEKDHFEYSNGTANKLSVGSPIFEANERDDILIVEEDGEVHYYYALVEG
ncbi:hypothetical protein [Alkalicoccobacillus gibsonii]|uniref:hypothetical protein n=1 Tax=Alkalicoccobacillus gibsonii TaxID=79881 RepID=UPI003516DF22